jgi:hypothetical protein
VKVETVRNTVKRYFSQKNRMKTAKYTLPDTIGTVISDESLHSDVRIAIASMLPLMADVPHENWVCDCKTSKSY